MVSRVGGDVRVMLTLFFFFYAPLPALLFSLYPLHKPVLEYRDKLFTHSNQKPASKERIQQQGIVKLSPSRCIVRSLILFPLSNLLTNQVMY